MINLEQCKEITRTKTQCRRPAVDGLGGYCKQHFDNLPPNEQAAAATRSRAKQILLSAGQGLTGAAGVYEVVKTIIDIAGPFLSFREERLLERIQSEQAPDEIRQAIRLLRLSLSRPLRNREAGRGNPSSTGPSRKAAQVGEFKR